MTHRGRADAFLMVTLVVQQGVVGRGLGPEKFPAPRINAVDGAVDCDDDEALLLRTCVRCDE